MYPGKFSSLPWERHYGFANRGVVTLFKQVVEQSCMNRTGTECLEINPVVLLLALFHIKAALKSVVKQFG